MFPWSFEPSEEDRRKVEQLQAEGEAQVAAVRRMLAEELTMDQIELLYNLLYMITNSRNPAVIAEWWEGVVWGVKATREIRVGELSTRELEKLGDGDLPTG